MGELHDLFPGIKASGENDKARAERCMRKIMRDLEEDNCGIVPNFGFIGLTMSAGITVVAKPYEVPATSPN